MVAPIAVVRAEINLSIDDAIWFFIVRICCCRGNGSYQQQRHAQEHGHMAKPFQMHSINSPRKNDPGTTVPTMPGFYHA